MLAAIARPERRRSHRRQTMCLTVRTHATHSRDCQFNPQIRDLLLKPSTHTHTRLSQAAEIINLPLQSQTSSRATPHSKFVLREAKLAIANDHVICIPFYKTMHRASAGSVLSTGLFYLLSVRALCYLYIVKRRLTYIDRANMIINKSDRTSGMRPVVAFTVWVMCRRLEIVDSLETFM